MPNHLIHEVSPYLQQHAHNPVDWYPWGKTALEKAQRENKPILLSIGYAACHWCHVMAHESFADPETAKLMNELFVNIKVDREERPDLDKIYQAAHYLLTQQSGGWPLTVFLTPEDQIPFFSGTYFPLTARYQLPAFKDVLKGIAKLYQEKHEDIQKQNLQIKNFLQQEEEINTTIDFSTAPIQKAIDIFKQHFDAIYGGLKGAPKFPQASILFFLLQEKSEIAEKTLLKMAQGGINDQIGGGFYRYAVDEKWEIPHFEKMLYDNGQLLSLYALAATIYQQPYFKEIAYHTGNWLLTDMLENKGGFYSSINADSEGSEGKFYIWDKEEAKTILSQEEYKLIEIYYGMNNPPNFENKWHFYITKPLAQVAQELKIATDKAEGLLNAAREKLLTVRNKRVKPSIDHKILTAANSLAIKGLFLTNYFSQEPAFLKAGEETLDFIRKELWVNKRLLASFAEGKAYLPAYLDDYAFLLDALLTSLQVTWSTKHLQFAIDIANTLLEQFYDENKGGFFFTAHEHEKLFHRPKPLMDEAIPSGNGVAVRTLLLLGHLLGESRYLEASEKTLTFSWPLISVHPAQHVSLLLGLQELLQPSKIIILRGEKEKIKVWQNEIRSFQQMIFAIPDTETNLPGTLALRKTEKDPCAYVCEGQKCSAVIKDITTLKNYLHN